MEPRRIVVAVGALAFFAGCSLLSDTSDLTGGSEGPDASSMTSDASTTTDAVAESAAPGDAGDAAPDAAPPGDTLIFSDDFSTGSPGGGLDGGLVSLWNVFVFTGTEDVNVVAAVRAQRLEMDLLSDAGGSHYRGITTKQAYDFTGARMIARVALAPPSGTAADWDVSVGLTQTNLYRVLIENGTLRGIATISAAPKLEYFRIAFDSVAMAFVSLRHDKLTDELVWETAPAATGPWMQRFRTARAPAIDIAQPWFIELKAGTFQPETSPGTVAFDDVVFSRAP
jgi:hypothetical protein